MQIIIKKKTFKNLNIPISGLIFWYGFDKDLCVHYQRGIQSLIILRTWLNLNFVKKQSLDISIQEAQLGVHTLEAYFSVKRLYAQWNMLKSILFISVEPKQIFDGTSPCSQKSSDSNISIFQSPCIFSTLKSPHFLVRIEGLVKITFSIRLFYWFGCSTPLTNPILTILFLNKLNLKICSIEPGLE